MDSTDHPRDLLVDVLAEGAATEFEQHLREQLGGLAKRRRRLRRLKQTGALSVAMAASLLIIVSLHRSEPVDGERLPRPSGAQAPRTPVVSVVRSAPLPDHQVVSTSPFQQVVRTEPAASTIARLSDQELLAWVAFRSPVLVRKGPQTQELILLENPDRPVAQ